MKFLQIPHFTTILLDTIILAPCIPAAWPGFEVVLQLRGSRYEIRVANPHGVQRGIATITLDGVALDATAATVPLSSVPGTHQIIVQMGVS